ncbi:hypothetical protein ABMX48_13810 [Streptomyces cavourensis]
MTSEATDGPGVEFPDALLSLRDLRVSYPGKGRRAPRARILQG